MVRIMPTDYKTNPLISDSTTDTLYKAHCLLRVLEDLYANQDKQWLQDEHAYTGMQLILQWRSLIGSDGKIVVASTAFNNTYC